MVQFSIFVFWIGVLAIFYTYLGYGIVLAFLTKFLKKREIPLNPETQLSPVTHLIAAYNEADFIEEKIKNSLNLEYPKDKYTIIIVTDGSTDATPDIVGKYPQIKLYHSSERKGKIHAVNRVMKEVSTPIVIYSDANTNLNELSIKYIARHYNDPQVGGVSGEKRIYKSEQDNASGAGEGIYWKYESWLKKKDSQLNSIVGAAGELFSIRTELFEEPPVDTIIEDFYLSLKIASKGYRFVYEPNATATETASASVTEEWKRKVRICAGGFQAMGRLKPLLNPFRHGMLSFQYLSHRVFRWTLAPMALPLVFLSNLYLSIAGSSVYKLLFAGQLAFYLLALLGWLMQDKKITIKGFFVPYYFLVMNLAVYAGLGRFLKGKQSVVWERAKRA